MLEKKMTVCHEYARASLKASKALFIKGDTDKLHFIKIRNFCSLKNIVEKKMKTGHRLRKYLQNTYLIKKSFYPGYIRNSQTLILLKQSYCKMNKDSEEMLPQKGYIDGSKQAYEKIVTDQ